MCVHVRGGGWPPPCASRSVRVCECLLHVITDAAAGYHTHMQAMSHRVLVALGSAASRLWGCREEWMDKAGGHVQ